jgi:hypothetical protein
MKEDQVESSHGFISVSGPTVGGTTEWQWRTTHVRHAVGTARAPGNFVDDERRGTNILSSEEFRPIMMTRSMVGRKGTAQQ